MHTTNHPHWDAAQRALAAAKTAEEVLAALLGAETYAEVPAKLAEQREPDLTMYLRSGVLYALRGEGAELERFYEDMRDAANRALPVDEAMAEINARLRRELDTAERELVELLSRVHEQGAIIKNIQMEVERLRGSGRPE